MRIVCISDTHSLHADVDIPDGDILLHAGDFTTRGALEDVEAFDRWLATLPHPHKFVVAGNHDFCFENSPRLAQARLRSATYLQDSGAEVLGLKIWGSPWQPRFFDWAFNLDRGEPLAQKWALIPDDTDILVTHSPPYGILDRTARGVDAGCEALRERLASVRPQLHLFGHIHEAYGEIVSEGTRYVNAAVCTLQYRPTNAAVVVEV